MVPPKSSIFNKLFHHKPSEFGGNTPIFWKHLYMATLRNHFSEAPGIWQTFSCRTFMPPRKRRRCEKSMEVVNAQWTKWHVKQTQGCSDTHPHTYYLKKNPAPVHVTNSFQTVNRLVQNFVNINWWCFESTLEVKSTGAFFWVGSWLISTGSISSLTQMLTYAM